MLFRRGVIDGKHTSLSREGVLELMNVRQGLGVSLAHSRMYPPDSPNPILEVWLDCEHGCGKSSGFDGLMEHLRDVSKRNPRMIGVEHVLTYGSPDTHVTITLPLRHFLPEKTISRFKNLPSQERDRLLSRQVAKKLGFEIVREPD